MSKEWPSLHIVVREHEWAPLGAITTRIKIENMGGGVSPRREEKSISGELQRRNDLGLPIYEVIHGS